MQDFVKEEFDGSPLHQELFDLLLKKYKVKSEKGFRKIVRVNQNFMDEYEFLVDSFNDLISNDIEDE